MIPSEDFVYCPFCRHEICLKKCKVENTYQRAEICINGSINKDISVHVKKYLCPYDKTVLKECF